MVVAQLGGGDAVAHGQRDSVDDFMGVVAEKRCAQDLVGARVDDDLHESCRLVDDAGPWHRRHGGNRQRGDQDVHPGCDRRGLGEAYSRQRRRGEQHVRDGGAGGSASGSVTGELESTTR